MRGLQLPLSQTQRIRLQRAFEKLHSLSSKANSDTSVTVADNIPVNYEDAFLKDMEQRTSTANWWQLSVEWWSASTNWSMYVPYALGTSQRLGIS